MFIHWGSVSLKGTEIGWSRGGKRGNRKDGKTGEIPVEIYDNLYREFNPTKFNAREWVEIAKSAGMKYMVFTSRHHDGFSMFDTGQSDYKITNSPFKRDVCAELAKACHEGGLRLGWYHSPPNWYHPDFMTENHAARFIPFLHGQVRELLSNYGQVDVMWFDGLGGKATDWDSDNLFKLIRSLQPHIIINNRCGLPGDFDTPEQFTPKEKPARPWETCMTINRTWAYNRNDTNYKSTTQLIRMLIEVAGKGGNFLLNVGPTPEGTIQPEFEERLRGIGAWLKVNGEAIYGTAAGPLQDLPWARTTAKGGTIYLHVFDWPKGTLEVAGLRARVRQVSLLAGGQRLRFTQRGDRLSVQTPEQMPDPPATVLVLRFFRSPAGS
jgi:alpha-L-fucosidase